MHPLVKAAATAVLALATVAALPTPAAAHDRYFTYTYDWFTPTQGEKEVELRWTQQRGGVAEGEVEFEYGVNNRYVIAPYLLLGREHGGDFDVRGWKLEQRYRFGKFAYNRLLPAVYLEVAKENDEPYELEGKFITSYLFGRGWIWSSNLILEQPLASHKPLEWGYATGISQRINDHLNVGLELFGNWTENEHFFGPTVGYKFRSDIKVLATAGFRYAGPEGGAVRLMLEKEWR